MKVRVNRLLAAGMYHVNFEVSDFTPDELAKMASFGVPFINLQWMANNGINTGSIRINKITNGYDAVFTQESDAKQYEEGVLTEIRTAMQRLRKSQDSFSSSQEVEF